MQDSISRHGTVLDNAAGMGQWWIVVVNIGQCWTVQQAWDSGSEHGTVVDSASKCDMDTMGTITLVT